MNLSNDYKKKSILAIISMNLHVLQTFSYTDYTWNTVRDFLDISVTSRDIYISCVTHENEVA